MLNVSVVPSFCSGSDHRLLRAKVRLGRKLVKKVCHSTARRKNVVYDGNTLEELISSCDWPIEEDPTNDYDRLLKGLRACGECASVTFEKNSERISKTTKEVLERRRTLRQDPNATHLEQLIANTSCRTALQEDLRKYRQAKILEAAEGRRSLKKCRRDLCEYHVPLAALLNEDGTPTSSRYKMESIAKNFYTNLFRSSTAVPTPVVPTGEVPPRILPAEVRTAIQTMKTSTDQTIFPSTFCEPEGNVYTRFSRRT